MSFLTLLECGYCGETYDADKLWNLCVECDKPLLARYDTAAAAKVFLREALADRESTLWRYREMLPVKDMRVALRLGEGYTPLIHAERLSKAVGFDRLSRRQTSQCSAACDTAPTEQQGV